MRGEYCVYGASVLSLLSAIFLIFANISQLSNMPLISDLYFLQMDTTHFGDSFIAAAGGADGLYAGNQKAPLGGGQGLRERYRYGVYGACAYMSAGSACNSTMFGYPFDPLGNIKADATTDRDIRNTAARFIGDDNLSDSNYNVVISRVANLLIFIGTALCGVALIVGFLKTRITFLTASISSGLSALLLMIGAAMWSACIARNSSINSKMINGDTKIGIVVSAGAALYLVWVAFVIQTLACIPYTISFMTFRKQNRASFQYSYPDN